MTLTQIVPIVTAALVLIFVVPYFAIERLANKIPPASAGVPAGVRGWLLFLVCALIYIGPLIGASQINRGFRDAERRAPSLTQNERWSTHKAASWASHAAFSVAGIYVGIALARRRDPKVIGLAKRALWVVGPASQLISGVVAPLLIFGTAAANWETLTVAAGAIAISCIFPAIWGSYLSKSQRVRNTYGTAEPAPGT